MAFTAKHATIATGTNDDGSQVSLNAWNDDHDLTATPGTLLGAPATSSTVGEITLGSGLTLTGSEITVTGGAWGDLTGTLSAQTDLQAALDAKEASITAGTTSQFWRGDKSFQSLSSITTSLNAFTTSAKGVVPAPGTASGKFLKDDGTWAAAGGGTWTQIATSTPTGTGTVTFSSIPATYTDLLIAVNGVSHDNASNSRLLSLGISNDGTTFVSPTGSLTGSITNTSAAYGLILFNSYRSDVSSVSGQVAVDLASLGIANSNAQWALRSVGGVSAVRLSWTSPGNFDAGTITLYGR